MLSCLLWLYDELSHSAVRVSSFSAVDCFAFSILCWVFIPYRVFAHACLITFCCILLGMGLFPRSFLLCSSWVAMALWSLSLGVGILIIFVFQCLLPLVSMLSGVPELSRVKHRGSFASYIARYFNELDNYGTSVVCHFPQYACRVVRSPGIDGWLLLTFPILSINTYS